MLTNALAHRVLDHIHGDTRKWCPRKSRVDTALVRTIAVDGMMRLSLVFRELDEYRQMYRDLG